MAMKVTKIATGNDQARHQRRAQVPQEQPDDEAGEQKSDDDGVAHAADRLPHDVGLIVKDVQLDAGGKLGPERFDFLVDHVGDLHRVAVRLAVDAEQHGGLSVRGDHRVVRRRRSRHGADVADSHRHVVHVLDDDVADLVRRCEPGQ